MKRLERRDKSRRRGVEELDEQAEVEEVGEKGRKGDPKPNLSKDPPNAP